MAEKTPEQAAREALVARLRSHRDVLHGEGLVLIGIDVNVAANEITALAETLVTERTARLAVERERDEARKRVTETITRYMKRADDAAISGAALASRLAAGDEDAHALLVQSVRAIRDPRAGLDRLCAALNEPMECGHPIDCWPDEGPGVIMECGWCAAIRERDEARAMAPRWVRSGSGWDLTLCGAKVGRIEPTRIDWMAHLFVLDGDVRRYGDRQGSIHAVCARLGLPYIEVPRE